MGSTIASKLSDILNRYESELLSDWLQEQKNSLMSDNLANDTSLRSEASQFLRLFKEAVQQANLFSIQTSEWAAVRDSLNNFSKNGADKGFTPSEIAFFLLSLKKPLFKKFRVEMGQNTDLLADELWISTHLLDQLALYTTEAFQRRREEVISRQQEDMLELSTPVVELWNGVLALPMIGTLDSGRTQIAMESLLQRIVDTGAEIAIVDITGVPTVDTLVAQHLLKTVTAARLMGAECIISGIRPQIAATIVHLGVDLGNVITKASLADAFKLALQKNGLMISNKAQLRS